MQLLAIESHAARDRLPPHAPHSSTPATNNMDYRHPTQTGTARSSPARPGSAPAFRGADYDYRLRPVASEQHAPRDPSRAASSAIQSQTSHWPCPYPEPQSRGNSIQPSPGSRRQKGHVPMPLEPRAAPANDPELSGWLRSDRYRPNQPLSNTGDELQAHPIGLSPQLELMRVEEATRTDTWHPGIPRPTWAKQRPSGAVVEPRHIAEQKPVYWRMRPYNRSFRANLHSVADSLP